MLVVSPFYNCCNQFSVKDRIIHVFIHSQEPEEEDFLKHFSLNRVMLLNSPEWFYLIVGAISSAFAGAISPAHALILSKVIEVKDPC